MATVKRIAPIFPVRDVRLSLEYYGRPGFVTREYEHGGYGFVTRDGSTKGSSLIPTANQTQARRGRDASALENPSGREVERFPRRYRRLPQPVSYTHLTL